MVEFFGAQYVNGAGGSAAITTFGLASSEIATGGTCAAVKLTSPGRSATAVTKT